MAESLVFVPEVEIYKILLGIIKYTRDDWNSKVNIPTPTPEKTLLYRMFRFDRHGNNMILSNFDWYQQAVEIFINKTRDNGRELDISFGFNINRSAKPTIHIMMPSETNPESPIGINEGYMDDYIESDKVTPVYTIMSNCMYNLMITSDNSSEVILIYSFLRSMLISMKPHLELLGYMNVRFGGSDVMLSPEFIPPTIFQRSISLSFDFDHHGIELNSNDLIQNIILAPTMIP